MKAPKKFEFVVKWGATEVKFGREHPNLNHRFNSKAVVEIATARVRDETPGILIRTRHPDFEGDVFGTVHIDGGRERAKQLAEFVSARIGKTVEEVATEVHASGLFS
jgi:hypothetical protein